MAMSGRAMNTRGVPEGARERVPPGQYVTSKFPAMSLGPVPEVDLNKWRLRLFGLVEKERELAWEEFTALSKDANVADFHCVTQWSKLNVRWEGVPAEALIAFAQPKPEAHYVMFHCLDGYTTNLDISAFRAPGVLFAYAQDGRPIKPEHGAPLRLAVPSRYGWKSAKWISGVEFMSEDKSGFWEARGYHMRGDPWAEERFA